MREIKFRAWVDGFLPEQTGMFYGVDLLRNTISGGYDRINAWRNNNSYKFKSEEEPFILMQYTGLKDRNGVEIYEGDIVKATKPRKGYIAVDFTGRVYWLDGQFQWWITDGTSDPANGVDYDLSYLGYFEEYEVIGNIYENPELLG